MSLPGVLLYHAWHRPANTLRELWLDGGPRQRRRTETGRRAMEAESLRLPLPPATGSDHHPLEVHLLTGERHGYQALFCLWTLACHAMRRIQPVVYDDGTLGPAIREALLRLFPEGRIVAISETRARLEDHLPTTHFPFLRERWEHYPNIRKLTDVHLGSRGWKLVLDSDLLFFRQPRFLVEWLDRPHQPLHAVDTTTSYGYSRPLMESLCGTTLAERLNVGLCGLESASIEWEKLEFWTRTLIEREKPHYFLEQALVAMMLAGQPCAIAPAEDYVTLPQPPEALECRAVMHHYVAHSKRWYFQHNWRRVMHPDPA